MTCRLLRSATGGAHVRNAPLFGCCYLPPGAPRIGVNAVETYTLGHSADAMNFMLRRTLESHGSFMLPHLRDGTDVLDCACGPGSITVSIAERFPQARVVGVDFAESQVVAARELAQRRRVANASFVAASAYALPFANASFDAVFSHALLEHLGEPPRAVAEFQRVLRPGGTLGVCTPDWGGYLLAPIHEGATQAVNAFTELQRANGGDVFVGRKLGGFLHAAGFRDVTMGARYEIYPSAELIAEFLAMTIGKAGREAEARAIRAWAREPAAMFAQAWVSATGVK